jgi:molybdopterin/thiamine biosynthesis adenylyltransferase/rhodanese-related sulfurtransferase
MTSMPERLATLRKTIREVEVRELAALPGPVLIDVREQHEWAAGHIPGARHLSRGYLELRIGELVPDPSEPVVLYCQTGVRSLFAAATLRDLGFSDVRSLAGGFAAWCAAGGEPVVPSGFGATERERYSRHVLIPEVGESGQRKLLQSSVLVVGAGGLGSPVALYLAAAGVGRIGIVDADRVDRSNLQRQILHNDERIGMPKTTSARRTLEALNPSVRIDTHECWFDAARGPAIAKDYDVVVDGCDNFPTRYLVNDVCVRLRKPNVHGAIHRFEGQVSVFWPGRGACYRCVHPEPPPDELAPNCAATGVLGVLPGVIGALEAAETIKVLLGIGTPLLGRLLTYDALSATFAEFQLRRDPACRSCAGV